MSSLAAEQRKEIRKRTVRMAREAALRDLRASGKAEQAADIKLKAAELQEKSALDLNECVLDIQEAVDNIGTTSEDLGNSVHALNDVLVKVNKTLNDFTINVGKQFAKEQERRDEEARDRKFKKIATIKSVIIGLTVAALVYFLTGLDFAAFVAGIGIAGSLSPLVREAIVSIFDCCIHGRKLCSKCCRTKDKKLSAENEHDLGLDNEKQLRQIVSEPTIGEPDPDQGDRKRNLEAALSDDNGSQPAEIELSQKENSRNKRKSVTTQEGLARFPKKGKTRGKGDKYAASDISNISEEVLEQELSSPLSSSVNGSGLGLVDGRTDSSASVLNASGAPRSSTLVVAAQPELLPGMPRKSSFSEVKALQEFSKENSIDSVASAASTSAVSASVNAASAASTASAASVDLVRILARTSSLASPIVLVSPASSASSASPASPASPAAAASDPVLLSTPAKVAVGSAAGGAASRVAAAAVPVVSAVSAISAASGVATSAAGVGVVSSESQRASIPGSVLPGSISKASGSSSDSGSESSLAKPIRPSGSPSPSDLRVGSPPSLAQSGLGSGSGAAAKKSVPLTGRTVNAPQAFRDSRAKKPKQKENPKVGARK